MSATAIALLLTLHAHNPLPFPTPEKIEAEGKVREVRGGDGTTTEAVLQLDDKSELVLHGVTEGDDSELRSLAGVRIKVRGVKGDPLLPRGSHIRVFEYDITDVGGGVVPRLGHFASLNLNGKPRILFVDDAGQADVLPEGYVAKMAKNLGARVWMLGTRSGMELVPTRFAILRPGPKPSVNDRGRLKDTTVP